ncbi:MAG: TonB family protein [Alistipes sp.]
MEYYDSNERISRRWAVAALVVYALLLTVSFVFVSFDFELDAAKADHTIFVEFTEPPALEVEPPAPMPVEPRMHDVVATVEQAAKVSGKDATTQTPNPRALFKTNKGGVDEPADVGNPHAPQGEDKASGKGAGLGVDGLDQLDRGLQGRGLLGALPRPSYPGNESGKIVVRVTVDATGRVTSATYEPKGSTAGASALIEAALAAARKAKFTESRAPVQGGTITYIFKLN